MTCRFNPRTHTGCDLRISRHRPSTVLSFQSTHPHGVRRYVIRRILRRAVRYGYTFLDRKEAFMYKLLPVLIETMGDAYPELIAQKTLIEKVIKEEEESFLRTLETGIRLLDKKMEETKAAGKTVLNGVDAFTLYDTYGFPLDLT